MKQIYVTRNKIEIYTYNGRVCIRPVAIGHLNKQYVRPTYK